jgi:hypothetical protein
LFGEWEIKGGKMKVLVACEESQAVTIELRKLGHEAYSCDIEPCSGGHPEWHLQQDVIPLLKEKWDMIIAFPPCTHLAVSGAKFFENKRADGRQRQGIEFFCKFLEADCGRIAIENPVGIISGNYIQEHFADIAEKYSLPIKPTQSIQPYEFGDSARKKTCLWLKGLPKLTPTNIVDMGEIGPDGYSVGAGMYKLKDENGKAIPYHDPRTAKIRSKTFPGIAKAMAEQWGGIKS